jgi:LmbE family N-acetylglucosaminyl deacetylase
MNLSQPNHDLFIPDHQELETAFTRTTHLGVGAHQDDLEFMALHGILAGFQSEDKWFSGVTCTDGAGSSRTGKYAAFSDEEMKAIRVTEQRTAATVGQYGFMAQLGHSSANAKDLALRSTLSADILTVLNAAQPEVVYTHNPFDKHATHIGVMLATLDAIHQMSPETRPKQLFGCEVWRALDWLPDRLKTVHDVSAHPNIASALNGVFDSQITGGKRYDLAVEGRRLANSTFFDSHSIDGANRVQYAIDLSTLMDQRISLSTFMHETLSQLNHDIFGQLYTLTST